MFVLNMEVHIPYAMQSPCPRHKDTVTRNMYRKFKPLARLRMNAIILQSAIKLQMSSNMVPAMRASAIRCMCICYSLIISMLIRSFELICWNNDKS